MGRKLNAFLQYFGWSRKLEALGSNWTPLSQRKEISIFTSWKISSLHLDLGKCQSGKTTVWKKTWRRKKVMENGCLCPAMMLAIFFAGCFGRGTKASAFTRRSRPSAAIRQNWTVTPSAPSSTKSFSSSWNKCVLNEIYILFLFPVSVSLTRFLKKRSFSFWHENFEWHSGCGISITCVKPPTFY